MTLYYIPIEPLEERYTEQWYREFPKHFEDHGYNTVVIDGKPLVNFVDSGTFLPMNSTVHYKNTQLQTIAKLFQDKKIKGGDIFFIADIEFWGIESIRLMADMNNIPVKIYGVLHAASYTKEDAFEIAAPYQKYIELGWMLACDGIFVGSEYHKQAFLERRAWRYATPADCSIIESKIHVTGNPVFISEYDRPTNLTKKKQLIISNRFDWEKRPNVSLEFAYILKRKHPDLRIVVTTSRPEFTSNKSWLIDLARNMEQDGIIEIHEGLSKAEYHAMLAESKLMLTNTIEENFGYCIVEALIYNTYPLAENAYSHPELCNYDNNLLFNDESEIISKAERLLDATFDVSNYVYQYTIAIDNMISYIEE